MEWWEQTAGRLNGRFVHLPAILLFIGKSGQQDIDTRHILRPEDLHNSGDCSPYSNLLVDWGGGYNTDTHHIPTSCIVQVALLN